MISQAILDADRAYSNYINSLIHKGGQKNDSELENILKQHGVIHFEDDVLNICWEDMYGALARAGPFFHPHEGIEELSEDFSIAVIEYLRETKILSFNPHEHFAFLEPGRQLSGIPDRIGRLYFTREDDALAYMELRWANAAEKREVVKLSIIDSTEEFKIDEKKLYEDNGWNWENKEYNNQFIAVSKVDKSLVAGPKEKYPQIFVELRGKEVANKNDIRIHRLGRGSSFRV